ncbi:MAG: hypothetical protein ACXVZV_11320 [Terriglobales bacterium]
MDAEAILQQLKAECERLNTAIHALEDGQQASVLHHVRELVHSRKRVAGSQHLAGGDFRS